MTRPADVLMQPTESQKPEPSPPLHRMHRRHTHQRFSAAGRLAVGLAIASFFALAVVVGLAPLL